MKEIVADLLKQLKALKIPASKIEKDLGFSNGQLGQVAKGKSKLSEERLGQLSRYAFLKLTDGKETGSLSMNPKEGEAKINPPDPDNHKKMEALLEEAKKTPRKSIFDGIEIKKDDVLPSKIDRLKKFTETKNGRFN